MFTLVLCIKIELKDALSKKVLDMRGPGVEPYTTSFDGHLGFPTRRSGGIKDGKDSAIAAGFGHFKPTEQ
jgi:hypothetical protein